MAFNYDLDFKAIDFRQRPELYRVGVGEQGVLLVEPYKSEILPFWRFRTPPIAKKSALAIYRLFRRYRDADDFVGMDMARKFLQMGYTRARRYANHKGGRKYDPESGKERPRDAEDPDKAESARIFYGYYLKAREDQVYARARQAHRRQFESRSTGLSSGHGRRR